MASLIKSVVTNKNFLSLGNNAVIGIFGFLNFMVLARTLSVSMLGEWVLYVASAGFIEMFRFGINRVAIIRFISGADPESKKKLIGSNWYIGLWTTFPISIILLLILFFAREPVSASGYYYFFAWYPLLAILNLPFNNAISVLQAEQRFGAILFMRLFNNGLFFIFLVINYFFLNWGIQNIVFANLAINLLNSLITIVLGWDGIKYFRHWDRETNRKILNFGKFSTGTLIGTNLIKSADTFLLGLSPFGTEAVALYSIPLKLTELLEMPLRSFIATAFPSMSKASIQGKLNEVRRLYYLYSGSITLLFVPICLFNLVFASFFIGIFGGEKYMYNETCIILFRIFTIYGLLLPIDRFSGVALDSLDRPKKNFYKIIVMASINIMGDLIAIYVFKSIVGVAFTTILVTLAGMLIGVSFLNKEISVRFSPILPEGIIFYREFWQKIRNRDIST